MLHGDTPEGERPIFVGFAARTGTVPVHGDEPPKDCDPVRTTERIRGEAVVQVTSPPGTRMAWFTAQGGFRRHLHEAARKTRNTMAFAADGAEVLREIDRAEVPADDEPENEFIEIAVPSHLARPASSNDASTSAVGARTRPPESAPRPEASPRCCARGF